MTSNMKPLCVVCGKTYSIKRKQIGFCVCLECGDKLARKKKHTIVPTNKSNYIAVKIKNLTDLEILKGINNKEDNK